MSEQVSDPAAENGHTPGGDLPNGATTAAVERGVADLLREGVAHHQAGRLYWANAQYRRVLAALPGHADALHHLGVIAFQLGQYGSALELINKAIQQDGNNPLYYISRGLALHGLKRLDEAIVAYDQAIALKPDIAEALVNRGLVLEEQERFEEALEGYDRAIALKSDFAVTYYNRGDMLKDLGRLDEAASSYDRALPLCRTCQSYSSTVGKHRGNSDVWMKQSPITIEPSPLSQSIPKLCSTAGLLSRS